jgi:hypothetical protein
VCKVRRDCPGTEGPGRAGRFCDSSVLINYHKRTTHKRIDDRDRDRDFLKHSQLFTGHGRGFTDNL